jgi:hypothetical protein
MIRCLATSFVIVAMLSGAVTSAVQLPSQTMSAPLTAEGIANVIGSEADAGRIVQLVLGKLLGQESRQVFVLASQVRQEWLPAVRADIVRLSDRDGSVISFNVVSIGRSSTSPDSMTWSRSGWACDAGAAPETS